MDVDRASCAAECEPAAVAASRPAPPIGALDPLPGLVWAFAIDAAACEAVGQQDVERVLRSAGAGDDRSRWIWLHFDLADRRTGDTVIRLIGQARRGGLPVPPTSVVHAFLHLRNPPQLHVDGGNVHGTLADQVIDIDGAKDVSATLQVVVGARLLITGRRMHLLRAEAMRNLARDHRLGDRPARAFETLARMSIDEHSAALQDAARGIDEIEDRVLDDGGAGERGRLGRLRHSLVRTSRDLALLVRLHDRAHREMQRETGMADVSADAPGHAADRGVDFVSLLEHLHQVDGHCIALLDRARSLQEEISNQLTVQTNRQLYVLSILTAMLVPPTIVTGLLGMNTGGLPLTQDATGFWQALGWCLLASVAVLSVLAATGVIDTPDWRRWRLRRGGRGRVARSSRIGHLGAPSSEV